MDSMTSTESTRECETTTEKRTKRLEIQEQYRKFVGRKIFFISFCLFLIVLISGISLSLGSASVTLFEAYSAVFNRFFPDYFHTTDFFDVVVWDLRLPRIVLGILAGFGLAIAGASMQGILKNPLASPYTLGIAHGAGFGATLAIIYGVGFYGIGRLLLIGNAFIFSLVPAFVILGLSRYKRATPETMILAGIAMGYLFSAATSLMYYFAEPEALKLAAIWIIGSLGRGSWGNDASLAIILVCCSPLLLMKAWDLNVMGAGDETAKSLGVNVERTRISVMMVASLAAAGIICFTGTIGFVGLVAPHITRMVIGGDNRFVILASGVFGAAFLIGMDLIARMVIAPTIIPVGIMTAFMGAPIFIYLIMRKKKDYW